MPVVKKRTELYVGLFIFIGLFLLGGLVLQFGKFRERLGGQYSLTVVFDDASGVIKGSEIRMGGARIGQVASLPELNDAVKVEVELSIREAIRIPKDSQFQINSATLLGDKLIVIIPPKDKNGDFIAPGSRLEGAGLTGLDAIQNNAEEVSRDVLRIIKEAEETFVKVDAAVVDIRSASTQLREAMNKVNTTMLSDENLKRFDNTLANLESTTGRWNATSEKFDPTIQEARDAIASIKSAAAGAETTLKTANQALTDLKPSLERIPKAVDQFTATTRKAGDTLDRMEKGEGMLGALASDNDVALDFKTFMRNLKEYGIFRYRNPAPANGGNQPKKKSPAATGFRSH
jgi:phospholipid/cholesterol/gamma-HCH transport system substrate-binding protein